MLHSTRDNDAKAAPAPGAGDRSVANTVESGAEDEGPRFPFGRNWHRFLEVVDERRVEAAEESLKQNLGLDDLSGLRFLDIGCGSGLFGLAARRLGASVHAFDYDPQSVACAKELRRRFRPGDSDWKIEPGSALDSEYLQGLGAFDIVYSWGVLHHTGDMRRALENALIPVGPRGVLFIAIYNDQKWISRYWTLVKRLYNTGPVPRAATIVLHTPWEFAGRYVVRRIHNRLDGDRGMSLWHDMLDWLGGYPFEYAPADDIVSFYEMTGLESVRVVRCGRRHGCNQFLFKKQG